MHGNVFEWVQDWFGMYMSVAQIDPVAAKTDGEAHIFRGGFFRNFGRGTRSAFRAGGSPGARSGFLGARLLRVGKPPTSVSPESWGKVKLQASKTIQTLPMTNGSRP